MEQAKAIIDLELQYFDIYFKSSLKSKVPLLDKILAYIAQRKGKQIRPMFVLLCARLGGDITDATYRAALFVEMIHTSSLIHDDIVDDASIRRGLYSINTLWKSKVAVFTGDHLFTKSVLLLLENGDYEILKILSNSIEKVIEGELLQMDKSRKLNLEEDVYFEIIKSKTAALLASACAAGATSTFNDQKSIDTLYQFGLYAGIAFQIKDDLFDYGNSAIGKPTGNDIKEKKVTLPLLYTLNNCSSDLKTKLIKIVQHKKSDKSSLDFLISEVNKFGGFKYANDKMIFYRDKAINLLNFFPPTEIRSSLATLVMYLTERAN